MAFGRASDHDVARGAARAGLAADPPAGGSYRLVGPVAPTLGICESHMTLADRVYESIRDRILDGRLAPGTFVREQSIAQELEVSRTPVREALGRLASEGFLERYPHRGFRLPDEPVRDVVELYPIIANLEVFALELGFARLGAPDLGELRRTNAELREALGGEDSQAVIELNHAFHRRLSARCANGRLCDLLDDLRAQVMQLELWSVAHWDHVEEAIDQHDAIIAAIEAGDEEQAALLLRDNRMQTHAKFMEEIEGTTRSSRVGSPVGG